MPHSSLAAVAAASMPTAATAVVYLMAFVMIRRHYPKVYFPRTYLGTIPEKDRTPTHNGSNRWDWLHTMCTVPDKFLLYHQSLDSYLFLRFLRTLIFICVTGACITWPILIPLNATGGGNSRELSHISIGNVKKKKHLYGHATVAWVFFSFVMFTVARERLWLIGLRQAWRSSKHNATRLSSRTVLFLSAPTTALDEGNMHRYFGKDAVKIWPATNTAQLQALISARDTKVEELESAEMSLIQNASKELRKSKDRSRDWKYEDLPKLVKHSLRPTHRVKMQPSEEVDSIDWLRDQVKEKEKEIERAKDSNSAMNNANGAAAVFVEFHSQAAAQRAYQSVASSDVLSLTPRFIGVVPEEIFWENLTLLPTRRISQEGIALAMVVAIIILWSIPVSLVGALANVQYLAENVKWLTYLNKLPNSALSLLGGLLPPILLSALARYVPNIFRYIFIRCGEPTKTAAELKVLRWYYVFQVLQVFLVTTFSFSGPYVIKIIAENPTGIPALLATELPKASTTYLTYFVVQALTNAPSNLLNYSDVIFFVLYDKYLHKTPRQKYNNYVSLNSISWGKVFPKYLNFVIIAIVYSCIAPLVLGFAAIGLVIFYFSYRYMLFFTVQPKVDTKGHSYTLALQQILTGVYLAELCLIGLFSLRQATGPTVMLIALLIATILFNVTTNRHFAPLEQFLPAELALHSDSDEQAPLLASAEESQSDDYSVPERFTRRISTLTGIPTQVVGPVARFFAPHVFANYSAMKSWLREDDFNEDDILEYSEEEHKTAYSNPAYASKTPVIWLAKDRIGVSEHEIKINEKAGLKCSDSGAWVDQKGSVGWSLDDFDEVPVFKKEIRW